MHDTDATTTTSRLVKSAEVAASRSREMSSLLDDSFSYVEVGLRDVRLGLVVVVVRDEVLDRVRRQNSRNSLQSCAASVLLCAITSAGRPVFSMIQAIVAVLPVPVAPSRVW